MRIGWIVAAVALGAFGCAHREQTAASAAYGQARDDFAIAYDAVKRGFENSATAGKYALRDVGNGIVQVTDASKAGAEQAEGKVEDAWIKTKIDSKYAMDKQVKLRDLKVDSNDGVVRLVGIVDNPQEAERAIRLALDTKGVKAVDSNIVYRNAPMSPAEVRTPSPLPAPTPEEMQQSPAPPPTPQPY